MTDIKHAAIKRLRNLGIDVPDNAGFETLSNAIGTLGSPRHYNTGMQDYVAAWMAPQRPGTVSWPFRPMKPHAHPRLNEINRAQPPLMTPTGTGNHNEYTKFMLGNGRTR